MFEGQDYVGMGSLGVSAYIFHSQIKRQGLEYSSLFDSFRRRERFNFSGGNASRDLFLGMRKEAFMQQKVLEAGRSVSLSGLLSNGIEGMEEAVRMGILETMSSPRIQERLGGQYSDTFNRIRSGSAAALQTEIEKLVGTNSNIPEFESMLLSSIKGRLGAQYKGQSYQSLLRGQAREYTMSRLNGLDLTKPVNVISSKSKAASMFGGQKGYWQQFEGLLSRLREKDLIRQDQIDNLFRDNRVFMTDNGSAYARLKTRAGEFNVPLKRNTTDTALGKVPVYHGDVRGNTRYSFIQNFFKAGSRGALETGPNGKLLRMSFEEAMFFNEDAVIFNAIENAQKSGKSVMSIIGGVGDFKPGEALRYGEYFLDDPSGQMVPLVRQTSAAVLGYQDMVESMGLPDTMRAIESQLGAEGIQVFANSSPAAIGKIGSFHMLDSNAPVPNSILGMLSRPDQMSGGRRPFQAFTRSWGVPGQEAPIFESQMRFGPLGGDDFVYSPFQHPLLKNDIHRKMLNNPVSRNHMTPRTVASSRSTMWNIRRKGQGRLFGMAEGMVAANFDAGRQALASEPEVFRVARPNEEFKSIMLSDRLSGAPDKGTQSLLDIANTVTNAEERRAALKIAMKNESWDNGYWLGQRFHETRGLTDEVLNVGGSGKIKLYDIVPDDKGYRLMFQRFTEEGDGSKLFGMIKGTLNNMGEEVRSFGKEQGLGDKLSSKLSYATDLSSELSKEGQFAQVRSQQATALRNILLESGGKASFIRELSADGVFDLLRKRGAGEYSSVIGLDAKMKPELMGLVDIAYKQRDVLNDKQLGLIFGLEDFDEAGGTISNSAVLHTMDIDEIGKALGEDGTQFMGRLTKAMSATEAVYGDALVSFRDEASRFPNSRPQIERRIVENLVNAPESSFVSFNNVNERSMLLSDIAAGLEGKDSDFLKAMKEMERSYLHRGGQSVLDIKKAAVSISDRIEMPSTGVGKYVKLDAALGADEGLFLPSKEMVARLAPAIDTSGTLDPIDSEYGRAVNRFVDATERWASNQDDPSLNHLRATVEGVRRQENVMRHTAKRSAFAGRMMHSQIEMTTGQLLPEGKMSTADFGMTVKVSEARAQSMFDRAISHFSEDADMVAELKQQRKAVMGGARGAMAVTRFPATSDRGRQIMAFQIDKNISDMRLHMGRRQVKMGGQVVDADPWLSMAGSADHDGDMAAFNLIAGKNSKAAFDMVNDLNTLEKLSNDRTERVLRMNVAEGAIQKQIKGFMNSGEISTNFVRSMVSHAGQAQIGLLSYQVNALKYAAFASRKDWGAGGNLTDKAYNNMSDIFYALEQEGVKFKHGVNVTEMLTNDLKAIYEMANLDQASDAFKNVLERWLGPEIFGEGIKYDIDGAERVLKLSAENVDQMSPGIGALRSDLGMAAYRMARMKSDVLPTMRSDAYQGLVEMGSKTGGLWELGQQMSSDILESVDDEGMSTMEKLLTAMNQQKHRAARESRMVTASKFMGPLMSALAVGGAFYSLFDRGYSSTELEAPTPGPDGRMGSSSIAMKMAIQSGELLREERGGPAYNRGQNQPMPMPSAPTGVPSVPNSIPTRSYVDNNTGRISVRAMVPSNLDGQQFADSLRVSMPHAQVGVNLTHQHVMPRDLTQEL